MSSHSVAFLMRYAVRASLIAVLALAGRPASHHAQTAPAPRAAASDSAAHRDYRYRYRVLGVFDASSGQPIEGVEVTDVLSGLTARTTRTGTVSLYFLPDSGSLLRLKKVGYEQLSFPVAISPADTLPVTIALRPATQLGTVTVTDSAPKYISPQLREFEDRLRNHAGGYFIDASTLRKYDDLGQMPSVLAARMPGTIQVAHGPHVHVESSSAKLMGTTLPCADWGPGSGCLSGTPRGCWIALYVDGVPVYTHAAHQDAPDLAGMQISNYAGVEFYPHNSSLPQQFSSVSPLDCGTLVLWTRER
jgi:hypothetical protein